MDQKRMLWLGLGGLLAVIIAVGLGVMLSSGHKDEKRMNDQPTGLTFNVSDSAPSLDSKKPLRCYVNGNYVGDMTLADCAKKNGVAAQKLDVGLDDNGNVVAAPTGSLAPVPTAPASGAAAPADNGTAEVVPDTKVASGPTAPCLRYNGGEWNKLQDAITLGQCVVLLYDQRCVTPGSAQYGRWGDKTLRLVPRRVEQSDDNTNFRTLVEQGQGCSVPMVR
ncbi:MAG: hypothetical protein ACXU8O_05090 [Asticcacaulis sp.]